MRTGKACERGLHVSCYESTFSSVCGDAGLHLFAEGLEDLRDALIQCDETVILKDLTKFIEDLIACTAGES